MFGERMQPHCPPTRPRRLVGVLRAVATLLIILVSVVGVRSEEETASIGAISCDDGLLHVHITNLLLGHGIPALFPGSVLHSIEVPVSRQKEAAQIVRQDALERGYPVLFGQDDSTPDRATFVEVLSNVAFKKALALPAYSRRMAIGKFLRREDVIKPAVEYPYIDSMEVALRQYLATPKKLRTGYIVRLSLRDKRAPSPSRSCELVTYFIDDKGHDLYRF